MIDIIFFLPRYEIFGKLFEEAIQFNFQASISRHPGLYFYEAGSHTINRRTLAMRLCSINAVPNISKSSFPLPPSSLHQSLNLGSAVRVGAESQLVSLSDSTSPDDYDKLPEFFGQRSWWNAGQTLDTADLMKEREGIVALQAKEALVDHSVSNLLATLNLYLLQGGQHIRLSFQGSCVLLLSKTIVMLGGLVSTSMFYLLTKYLWASVHSDP